MKEKKFLRIVIVLLMLVLVMSISDTDANAATLHSQNEAVNWAVARANEKWQQDVDGVCGCQCVDLIMAYYQYLVGYHVSGNAKDYGSNSLPSGWVRVKDNPQPGDIVVWEPALKWDGALWNSVCKQCIWTYWNYMESKRQRVSFYGGNEYASFCCGSQL